MKTRTHQISALTCATMLAGFAFAGYVTKNESDSTTAGRNFSNCDNEVDPENRMPSTNPL